ncbi:MAG: DsbA family protein [Bauldia sp.]|nr:DsbA family protein [Bauldia sp.]
MNSRLVVAFAVVAATALGVAGYLVGVRAPDRAPDRAAVAALVKEMAGALSPTPASAAGESSQPALTESEQREVEAIIRNYLIANPEIIRDAINELQRKEDAAARMAQTQVIRDNGDQIFNAADEVVLGNPDGDVTLVEFFDYNCTYCRRAHADMKQLIAEDPNLRFVLKQFPILGEGSVEAAQVAVAIQLTTPERYGEFHDVMLTEPGQVDGERALAVAEDLGLDVAALKVKADTEEVKATITESHLLAQKLDLTGTPSYVTAQQVVVGAVGYDALKTEIQKVRDCAATATC